MNRRDFLTRSSCAAAGYTLLARPGWTAVTASLHRRKLSLRKLASYKVIAPDQATPIEQKAAATLADYLSKRARTQVAPTTEGEYRGGPALFVGKTRFAAPQGIDLAALKQDGFAWIPAGKSLIVAGGTGKGLLNGVYDLLELWGCRMYTSATIAVPDADFVSMPARAVTVIPQVQYRTTSYRDALTAEYTDWHRISSRADWGLFVHTFNTLVPPEKYGSTHPEYFSLVNGNRLPGTQLCLSNHDVLIVLVASLKEQISRKPNATYWSVSQNDNDQYCHCDPCTQLNVKYGGVPSGSILGFVNEVAKAFPDKVISTLAYWYSRTPPQGIQAEPNVNIMLCNIESKRQEPVFETDPAFSKELIAWGKISNNILIWDYNIQFANLVSPFPNLHTIKPNIRFYTQQHVNSLFMQANSQAGGEMAGLRAYLISKLMWDPNADDSAIMDDYLNGYYGPAGRFLRQYIDTMRESLASSKFQLNIFGSPEDAKDAYLSEKMLKQYQALFDQAEKAVNQNAQLLTRVQTARLPIMYAEIQIGRNEMNTSRSMFSRGADGKVLVKPEMKLLVEAFVRGCKQDGVTRVRERTTTPDEYKASYDRMFAKIDLAHGAHSLGKRITPLSLPEGGPAAAQRLTDGLFGSFESWSAPDVHWTAYKGTHIDFVLDLGEVQEVRYMNMDFLNAQAQPDWNVLILPVFVSYAMSRDGLSYEPELRVRNLNNPNPKENPHIVDAHVQSFRVDPGPGVRARYIKVHGESPLRMPSWHIRAGKEAWLYTDQIVVF